MCHFALLKIDSFYYVNILRSLDEIDEKHQNDKTNTWSLVKIIH